MGRSYTLRPFVPEVEGAGFGVSHGREFSPRGADGDARGAGTPPLPVPSLLSMGHKSSPSILRVWDRGSRADFPASRDWVPSTNGGGGLRGKVTFFSSKSRKRLQREIARIDVDAETYTMALTLPGGGVVLAHEVVMAAFKVLNRRIAARWGKLGVCGFWKRELQKRGALHYHLLLYGLADSELRAKFHTWIVQQWNSLLCEGLSAEQREHHRWFHARPEENMQLVSDSDKMNGYFEKYIGKDVDSDEPIPGRWWGSFNKDFLPFVEASDSVMDRKAAAIANRLARKARMNRVNFAKARSEQRKLKDASAGPLALTPWQVHRLRCGYDLEGFRNPDAARLILECYRIMCRQVGVKPGKARFVGVPGGKIVLCGRYAPGFARQVENYLRQLNFTITPYEETHQPRKTPRRIESPARKESPIVQSDFLGGFRDVRRVCPVDDDEDYRPLRGMGGTGKRHARTR